MAPRRRRAPFARALLAVLFLLSGATLWISLPPADSASSVVMPEVRDSEGDGEAFAAKAKVLKELIEHHAEEEEKEMFPKARKILGRGELVELGRRIQARKQELQRR